VPNAAWLSGAASSAAVAKVYCISPEVIGRRSANTGRTADVTQGSVIRGLLLCFLGGLLLCFLGS
jgi:hypothetical protein